MKTETPKNFHHRKPHSHGGTQERSNMSYVPVQKHIAWHLLFGNFTPEEIASIINTVWLDPEYTFIVERIPK